jgi:hypothetical protein
MASTDEITEWLARAGRTALDLETAKLLAAESPQQWYVASHGMKGYLVGKMTLQKYSARHILVTDNGQPMLFKNVESAKFFLRYELRVSRPHIFDY